MISSLPLAQLVSAALLIGPVRLGTEEAGATSTTVMSFRSTPLAGSLVVPPESGRDLRRESNLGFALHDAGAYPQEARIGRERAVRTARPC